MAKQSKRKQAAALLAASALNLFSASVAYAGSGSTGVGVSVTVIRSDEKEITVIEPSSNSSLRREKSPGHVDNIAPQYNFDQDNYEWFDYPAPADNFYEKIEAELEREKRSRNDVYGALDVELNKKHAYWWYVDDADLHADHQVQQGDTVFTLCKAYAEYLSLENCLREVKKENPKLENLDKLRVGQELRIPSLD